MRPFHAAFWIVLAAVALLIPSTSAAISYSDVAGTTVGFNGINDDDVVGLWGQPVAAGDSLVFSPTSYLAECPGVDCPSSAVQVDSTLEFTIVANPGESLGIILFEESGTASVLLNGGSAQVGVAALITAINITALDGTTVSNIQALGPNLVFAPDDTFSTAGVVGFSGSASIDLDAIIAAAFPLETRSATTVTITLNNPLTAFAFGDASGLIQKDEFRVIVVPEPGTALLFGLGLMSLAIRRSSQGRS